MISIKDVYNNVDDSNIDTVELEGEYELEASYKEEEAAVYPMKDVKVDKGFYTVFELKRKYDTNRKIILDSSFQREDVWKQRQKAELIESVLMGLPLPIFYFNQDKFGNLVVIDGRQRLTALFQYIDNKYNLGNLKILSEYNNKKFMDLEPIMKSKIEDYQIQAHVILPPTPDRIKFDIFDRVNRAGIQLNKQEIRNALYQGIATETLNEVIRDSKYFHLCTGNTFLNSKRMKEKYIILRFIAFYLYLSNKLVDEKGQQYEYKNDIDDLLGKTMDYMNSCDNKTIYEIKDVTEKGLENSYYYLGEDAFRLLKGEKRSPINMNIFETVMFVMHQLPQKNDNLKTKIIEKFKILLEDKIFLDSIGNHRDNWAKISVRFDLANEIVKDVIGID